MRTTKKGGSPVVFVVLLLVLVACTTPGPTTPDETTTSSSSSSTTSAGATSQISTEPTTSPPSTAGPVPEPSEPDRIVVNALAFNILAERFDHELERLPNVTDFETRRFDEFVQWVDYWHETPERPLDVIALQEVDQSGGPGHYQWSLVRDAMIERGFSWVGYWRASGANASQGHDAPPPRATHNRIEPIFYRTDRFTLVDSGSESEAAIRRITWARLREITSGHDFYVFNVHVTFADHETHRFTIDAGGHHQERRNFAATVIERLILTRDTNAPYLVMGDFNAPPQEPAMRYLTGGVAYGEAVLEDCSAGACIAHPSMRAPLIYTIDPTDHRETFSWLGAEDEVASLERYDYVLAETHTEVLDADFVQFQSPGGARASDHWPVWTSVALLADPTTELDIIAVHNDESEEAVVIEVLAESVNLGGWRLEDRVGGNRFDFPAITVHQGEVLRVTSGQGTSGRLAATHLFFWPGPIWDAADDSVLLFDRNGVLHDHVGWSAS